MSVTILVCPCGRRLKAAGMAPGKSGRCPDCGRTLRMPGDAPAPPGAAAVSDEDVFDILRQPEPAPATAPEPAADEDEWNWQGTYDLTPDETPPAAAEPFEG